MDLLTRMVMYFSSQPDEKVLADDKKFKERISVSNASYAALSNKQNLDKLRDFFAGFGAGTSLAASKFAANFFFTKSIFDGILVPLGIKAVVTPVGWVVVAGFVTGSGFMGLMYLLGRDTTEEKINVPAFIETPLDAVALELLGRMMPLALYMANADGEIDERECRHIAEYFANEWGYNSFVAESYLQAAHEDLNKYSPADELSLLFDFCRNNPECSQRGVAGEVTRLLKGIMKADGKISRDERKTLQKFKKAFKALEQEEASNDLERIFTDTRGGILCLAALLTISIFPFYASANDENKFSVKGLYFGMPAEELARIGGGHLDYGCASALLGS